MLLWSHWWVIVAQLRPACSRQLSFLWLAATLAAMGVRRDLGGVKSACYGCLLDFFHSPALCVDALARIWVRVVLKVHPGVHRIDGRLVLLADGLKKSKAGRKMPAVKSLHQASESDTKPAYIMGHSCQALALLVQAGTGFQALPLTARIHEGVVFSNRDKRTLIDKLLILLAALQLPEPVLLVADAYYACGKIIAGLLDGGGHLISRLKKNACAYAVPKSPGRPGRGRPGRYGIKVVLRDLFTAPLTSMPSPIYDDRNVTLQYTCHDPLLHPAGRLVRFVAQGLLQCLAAAHPALVWRHFGSWLRTVRSPLCPSEFVVACAFRHTLPEFLSASPMDSSFELFLRQRLDLELIERTCLAA